MIKIRGKQFLFPFTIGLSVIVFMLYIGFSGLLFAFMLLFNDGGWSMAKLWAEASKAMSQLFLSGFQALPGGYWGLLLVPLIDVILGVLIHRQHRKFKK